MKLRTVFGHFKPTHIKQLNNSFACSFPHVVVFCDFEDRDICNYVNDNTASLDWSRENGFASVVETPRVDHSLGTDNGKSCVSLILYNHCLADCTAFKFHPFCTVYNPRAPLIKIYGYNSRKFANFFMVHIYPNTAQDMNDWLCLQILQHFSSHFYSSYIHVIENVVL